MISGMRRNTLVLLCIVLVSFFFRFLFLNSLPLSFQDEEAGWGVQANSIAQTGKDIFGQPFPLYWRLPESPHLPLYGYMTALSVTLFGLNEFAVRFPAAFFGALTPLVLFFLVKRLLKNEIAGFASAIFLAFSPWHIPLSRWGNEATLFVFFLTFGLERFFAAIEKKQFPAWTVLFFTLALLSDMTGFLLAPLVSLMLILSDRTKEIRNRWRIVIIGLGLFSLILFLLNPSLRLIIVEQSIFGEEINPTLWLVWVFFRNLFSVLSFEFLFFHGDERLIHGMNDIGLLFLGTLPLVFIGLYALLTKFKKQTYMILSLLVGISAVAALSRFVPDARTFLFGVIPLSTLAGLGLAVIIEWSKRVWWKRTLTFALMVVLGYNVLLAGHLYFGHYNKDSASQTQAVYKQLWVFINQHMETYDRIVLSGRTQSNLFMHGLFFLQIDPGHFQASGSKHGFDNFLIGDLSFDRIPDRRILLIAEPDFIPGKGEEIAIFSLADGNAAFIAWDIQR